MAPTSTSSTPLGCRRWPCRHRTRAPRVPAPPRIGLVLGAGGAVGGAFHAGVLSTLADELGWDARTAEVVVGTSAGSATGAILRAGLSPDDLARRARG